MTAEDFKNLPTDKRVRALHLAINCNGRIGSGPKFDEVRYHRGQKTGSTYPLSLMRVILGKAKWWKTK